jgi:anti-sigma regulatory factor (Ser/Thr protein kinase)
MAKRQFEFKNSNNNISFLLKQLTNFVSDSLPLNADFGDMLFKTKIIVTELLTNSIKHSEGNSTLIDIEAKDGTLTIIKTDHDMPLDIIKPTGQGNRKKLITSDFLHTLFAVHEQDNQVQFICEENSLDDILMINDIVEHFGLLIITKSANKFTYTYDCAARANIFRVMLRY